jgi:TonB-linked SusC/RagA family outer membrane protein
MFMKKYIFSIVIPLFVLLCFTLSVSAQQKQISGLVLNADGKGIPSATVTVVETRDATATNQEGRFFIKATPGQHLEISSVGYLNNSVEIGQKSSVVISLKSSGKELGEVIVTALGISRDKRALGYAVQEVSGQTIKNTAETNVVNALAGQAAGVYVNSSNGNVGSSSRIVIRGNQSLTGNNQPLFVVDGVPIDNSIASSTSGGMDFTDIGNGAADINPSDIANITILKGGNAAALYGARGANGVVLITTKSGKGTGFSVSLENSTTFSNPLLLPTYQNEYGQGGDQQYWYKDGKNGGNSDGVDESFGPRLDYRLKPEDIVAGGKYYWAVQAGFPQKAGDILVLPQFSSPVDPVTGERVPTPWISHPNNVRSFYETGITRITNLSLSNGGKWGSMRLSLTNSDEKGMLPNTNQIKNTLNFSTTANLSDRLSFEAKGSYVNSHGNLGGSGYSDNSVGLGTIWTGRQIDFEYMKTHIQNPDGTPISWNNVFEENPYWIQYKNLNPITENRFIGSTALKYQLNNWLSLRTRAGIDYSNQQVELKRAYYGITSPEGKYSVSNYFRQEVNADVLLSAVKNITKDISLTANVGANIMNRQFRSQGSFVGRLVVADNYSLANAKETPTTSYYKSQKEIQSVYGSVSLGYQNQLYLDLTGRNDWSSTLAAANNSYFYPSATASWIFSKTLNIKPSALSFGKVRLSVAQVGNDTDPFRLNANYFASQPYGNNPSFVISSSMPPGNLVNELVTSTEGGLDLKFFNNRLGLDLTAYKSIAKNQILSAPITPTSGFNTQTINAGQVNNWGIEATITGTPIKTDKFAWDITANWSTNKNKIIALNGDIKRLQLYKTEGDQIIVVADVNGSYGDMWGKGFVYNENGKRIVDADGVPLTGDLKKLGNIMPDWLGSINNSFSYRNFNFSFLIDTRWGGKIYSRTNQDGWATGALTSTVGLNAKGVSIRDPLSVGGGYLFDGVFQDGKPNDVYQNLNDFRWDPFAMAERWLYDATYVKLRQVMLTYQLPKSLLGKIKISGIDVSVFARNVAILYKNSKNFDPEVSNRGAGQSSQGSEFAAPPSARNIGARIRVTF